MRSVLVVGASLAGLSSARALREEGFDGAITLVGDEIHRPYDRPPLSKQFLEGVEHALPLETPDDDQLDLEWQLGVEAAALDPSTRSITLADGTLITSDAVVIATGASAIRLPGTPGGVHVLRTVDDARALREELLPGVRVVVIGAGFIGCETASTAVQLGCQVTVVEAGSAPLARLFGEYVGGLLAAWHGRGGARLITGASVTGFDSESGRVTAVRMSDGRSLPADVVVVGIGSRPNTDWLVGSGVELRGGVVTDTRGQTSIPGVSAVGDCACVRDRATDTAVRDEHWTAAATRPSIAIKALLGGTEDNFSAVPYVWSDQYRSRIQFAGRQSADCVAEIVEGDPELGPFVAIYSRRGAAVAVLAVSSPRSFGKWRRQLVTQS